MQRVLGMFLQISAVISTPASATHVREQSCSTVRIGTIRFTAHRCACVPADSWNETHCTKGADGQCLPRPVQGLWNEIAVGGMTMRDAISGWWNGDDSKPAPFVHDPPWDPNGKAPGPAWPNQPDHPPPIVPWYTSRFITNPTCRGMPWY